MKEQVEALLDKLKNHEDVTTFSFYEDKEQNLWDFYYHATGWYKDVYFMIGMNKYLNSRLRITISFVLVFMIKAFER